ncbi:hypothetical protein BKA63DRAFT_447931 [Paraphoma chrysanthemicola]|nr:hypothetical protein BKA63DRAFT_447931 [Paraphoma chrysanthemicola]
MQAISKLAFYIDELSGRQVMRPLYKNKMFCPDTIDLQSDSILMRIPPEIRLVIYGFVFAPPKKSASNKLSILAICRQIHEEAVIPALRQTHFHMNGQFGLKFQSTLHTLGNLAQYLRHIEIAMPLERLDASSANNPFVLTDLPLDFLQIDFGRVWVSGWLMENRIYHQLISALLHRTLPTESNGSTKPVHKTWKEKYVRKHMAQILVPWAKPTHLHHMLLGMKTKKVLVMCKANSKDLLWSAFTHFGLVSSSLTILRKAADDPTRRYVMFWDEGGHDVVEMGIWKAARS